MPTLDRITCALPHLPGRWTVHRGGGRTHLHGPGGLTIEVTHAHPTKQTGHIRAAAVIPPELARLLGAHPYPSIGIGPGRTPEQIGQAIASRLLPRARAALAVARANRAALGGAR